MKSILINGLNIGKLYPPYIIAELSGNHNNSIERAIKLIQEAKTNGASAVKIQTFTPDCLTLNTKDKGFLIDGGTWDGYNLYELYQKTQTPFEWHEKLFNFAKEIGITLFSSPFSPTSLEFLARFNPPAYKIASNELHDWKLVEEVAKKKKPILMSTGVATLEEIEKTIKLVRKTNNNEIIVLHCISNYPALSQNANIKTVAAIQKKFDVIVGFSDHTLGDISSCAAVTQGASVIEKHFTLDRSEGGPDSSFSIEPNELKALVAKCYETWECLGSVKYASKDQIEKNVKYVRQIWSYKKINKGEYFSWDNVKSIRGPFNSGGISTMKYNLVIGNSANQDIAINSPILLNYVKP